MSLKSYDISSLHKEWDGMESKVMSSSLIGCVCV